MKGNLAFQLKDYRAYSQANSDVNSETEQNSSSVAGEVYNLTGGESWSDIGSWKIPNNTFGLLTSFTFGMRSGANRAPFFIRTSGTNGIFPDNNSVVIRIANAEKCNFGAEVFGTGNFSGTWVIGQFAPNGNTGSLYSNITFQSINTHTHSVNFNIYENTLTSPSVTVKAGEEGSESTVGTYNTNQNALDITSYIQGAGSWTNVKFTPNKLMRIEANFFCKEFIESK